MILHHFLWRLMVISSFLKPLWTEEPRNRQLRNSYVPCKLIFTPASVISALQCPAHHWTARNGAETTREMICSKVYTLWNIFSKTGLGLRNRALPFPQHNMTTFFEQNVLVSGDLEEVLAGTPAFLVVSHAAGRVFFFHSLLCVFQDPKPDGNKGKLLTEASAKTFHLKRKHHLCTLPPPNPLFPGAVSQLTHSLVLVLISFH